MTKQSEDNTRTRENVNRTNHALYDVAKRYYTDALKGNFMPFISHHGKTDFIYSVMLGIRESVNILRGLHHDSAIKSIDGLPTLQEIDQMNDLGIYKLNLFLAQNYFSKDIIVER